MLHLRIIDGEIILAFFDGQVYNKNNKSLRIKVLNMTNEEISLKTKRMMANSLKKMLIKKPFSKITVSEIIRDCEVNRKTFYYHFADIYALLQWMFEEEAFYVVKNFDLPIDYHKAVDFVMDYVDENTAIINSVYNSVGCDVLKRFFYNDFNGIVISAFDRLEKQSGKMLEPDYKVFLGHFTTEAVVGVFMQYVQNPDERDRKKAQLYFSRVFESLMKHFLEVAK